MRLDATEKEIENSILEYLALRRDCFAFKVNTTGIFDQRRGHFRTLSKNIVPGTADILCCLDVSRVGVFIALEVKTDKGKQSLVQKEFQVKIQGKNGYYFIVRSVHDTILAIQEVIKTVTNTQMNV